MTTRSRGNSGSTYDARRPGVMHHDSDLPDVRLLLIGFRLALDGEFQRYTGSGYPRGEEFVRKQHSGGPIHALTKSGGMGFRLAWDRRDT